MHLEKVILSWTLRIFLDIQVDVIPPFQLRLLLEYIFSRFLLLRTSVGNGVFLLFFLTAMGVHHF